MAGTAVGRHQQVTATNAGFAKSDAKFLFRQTLHVRMACSTHDVARRVAFGGAANDQHLGQMIRDNSQGQLGKVLIRPPFCRAVGSPCIHGHHGLESIPAKSFPHQFCRLLVVFIGGQSRLPVRRGSAHGRRNV